MNSNKISTAAPGAEELQHTPHSFMRAALIVTAYLSGFIILDYFSQQFEELRGIVAWYPPAGLTYTLLLVFGKRFTPAVTIGLLISSLLIYHMPQPLYLLLLWAIIISLIYGIAAWFLRQQIHIDWQLRKLRDVTWLVITTIFVSALLAVLSVSSSALSSDMPRSEIFRALFLWWIGETVGVLTVAPFLLIHVIPSLKRFAEGEPIRFPKRRPFPRPKLSVIGQALSMALVFSWVFGGSTLDEFRPMYLVALPLIWIALDHGIKGVTIGIVVLNFGVTLAMWIFQFDITRLGELQLLMIVNCIIGLFMGIVITERKRAEEELRQLNAKLEQRVEERTWELCETQERLVRQEKLAMLGQLAGAMSHELRNPLGVISNAIYYLKLVQPDVDEKIKRYLNIMEKETRNSEKIINDLQDFASNKSVDRIPIPIPELVQRVLVRFPVPISVEVVLELPTDLPKVIGDRLQMEQVLGNLILNAWQAMASVADKSKGSKLKISAKHEKEMVELSVTDTGVGVPLENIEKIFEPLFTTKSSGIGLGLAVCRKLVEANEGRIEVESEPNKGSTFKLILPACK